MATWAYVETQALGAASAGESKRQYFSPALLECLTAAELAAETAGFTREESSGATPP